MRSAMFAATFLAVFMNLTCSARAADDAPATESPAAAEPTPTTAAAPQRLPQKHEYQRTLRSYLATLSEKDFDHGVTAKLTVPPVSGDLEHQYRDYIYGMLQSPHVGGKRGIGAINAPSLNYLLSTMESPKGVIVPPIWTESMTSFLDWDSAGNPYRDNKQLRMRAFVGAAVKLMMVDNFLEENVGAGAYRADWNGYHLITAACTFHAFKNIVPAEVCEAYKSGLKSLAKKLIAMGPKGESCDFEGSLPVGLWYAAKATNDPELIDAASAAAKKLCSDPRFFHPAGYWVERGGLDVGFGGMANFWTIWLALASDSPEAKAAVEKAYRLKSHLVLPEPDGKLAGPSAFNNRLGSPASEDQWDWDNAREHAAAMVTDEAAMWPRMPEGDALAEGTKRRTDIFNDHLFGLKNPPYTYPDGKRYLNGDPKTGRYLTNEELRGNLWAWRIFANGFNYPIEINPGYEFYRKGAYAHMQELKAKNSPMLRSPYLRGDTFVRNLGDAFIAVHRKGYAAILHVGPVGESRAGDGYAQYDGPLGFGGGQLAAFWTPEAGSALLTRRGGCAIMGPATKNFDKLEEWRNWPLHAVTGVNAEGKIFTSARIVRPEVKPEVKDDSADVLVAGAIPGSFAGQPGVALTGQLDYARRFRATDDGVAVKTTVKGDGKDKLAELYETIPVYYRDAKLQPQAGAPGVEFQSSNGDWKPASDAWSAQVKAVRIKRFTGSVLVTFDSPRRVKLSPADWKDTFLTRAVCRNVLVDLLESQDQPRELRGEVSCGYRVSPSDP